MGDQAEIVYIWMAVKVGGGSSAASAHLIGVDDRLIEGQSQTAFARPDAQQVRASCSFVVLQHLSSWRRVMRVIRLAAALAVGLTALYACERQTTTPNEGAAPSLTKSPGTGDPAILALMKSANEKLRARGLHVAVEGIHYFTIGDARPSNRIHAQEFRWVPNDPRRVAQGDDITYLIATNRAKTASGLTAAQTTAAIQRGLATWSADEVLSKVDLIQRPYSGGDVTIFDELIDAAAGTRFDDFRGQAGNPFVADIVNAGWLPRAYFETAGGPGGGRGILAFSVSFIFTNPDGTPTDINGDGRLDTALNEVYYNDTFGDPESDRADRPWGIDAPPPGIDVETVALHENGHSLGVGHFGPPPDAVMNPVYAGIRHLPLSPDDASMSAVWSSWPNP
jgi:Matrixin